MQKPSSNKTRARHDTRRREDIGGEVLRDFGFDGLGFDDFGKTNETFQQTVSGEGKRDYISGSLDRAEARVILTQSVRRLCGWAS